MLRCFNFFSPFAILFHFLRTRNTNLFANWSSVQCLDSFQEGIASSLSGVCPPRPSQTNKELNTEHYMSHLKSTPSRGEFGKNPLYTCKLRNKRIALWALSYPPLNYKKNQPQTQAVFPNFLTTEWVSLYMYMFSLTLKLALLWDGVGPDR